MSTTTLSPETVHARHQLLCRSTQVGPQANTPEQQIKPHLQRLHELLANDLRALARQGSPDDFVDIYLALQQELECFREFCSFPALGHKVLVAFGGGFSAGKSSLINALLGTGPLVTEIDPTTSLPTYLLRGEVNAIQAHNLFGHRIDLTLEEFRSLTHDEVANYGSNISRLLRSAFISRADFPWQHLAIIDTPGYTKHENPAYSDRTDEQLARNQLNAAHAIVWVTDARKGCITEDDLKFLATLKSDIPRLIVLTRADQKSADEVRSIVAGIRHTLQERNSPFVDVLATSARETEEWPLEPVRAQLAVWSTTPRTPHFAENFKIQFECYNRFIEEEKKKALGQLADLNKIQAISDNQNIKNLTKRLNEDINHRLKSSKNQENNFSKLRQLFFAELKIAEENIKNNKLKYTKKIGVFGKNGVGKTILCNALFGQDADEIGDITSRARDPKEILLTLNNNDLKLVNFPWVGEIRKRDEDCKSLYKNILSEIDLVLWIFKEDDRIRSSDKEFYKIFIQCCIEAGKPLLVAINQVDKIWPFREWDEKERKPSENQLRNINAKRQSIAETLSISENNVIGISATECYGLIELTNSIIEGIRKP